MQKPPLVYWTMLVSTSVLGGSEFALRLPNALATVGWIVATYLIMRRLGGERFGLASAMVLASMLGVWIFNHLVQPEPFLACFISLALWCVVEARLTARPMATMDNSAGSALLAGRFPGDGWYLLFWLFLALGALSKGLHGALWPLGTVLLAAIFVPGLRPWLKPVLSLRGLVLFFALMAPWYIYMSARLPGFLAAHFINEQLGATLNTRYPADARQLPLAQFYGQHLLFWMPWTLLAPGAVYVAAKTWRRADDAAPARDDARRDLVKMLGWWLVLTQVSVAFSTRQDYYSMSSWGVVAGFLALPWITDEQRGGVRVPRAFLAVPCALVLAAGALALGFVAWITPRLGAIAEGTAAPIRDRDTFMDAIAGISPGLWAHFITLLGIFGAAMFVAGAASTTLALRREILSRAARAGRRDGGAHCPGHGRVHHDELLLLAGAGSPRHQRRAGHRARRRGRLRGAAAHRVEPLLLPQRARALGERAVQPAVSAAGAGPRARFLLGRRGAARGVALTASGLPDPRGEPVALLQGQLAGLRVVNKSGTRLVVCNR
ncbi:MAG: glycosyltransferase family 39 protein [Verrucomicrobiota bacterium]